MIGFYVSLLKSRFSKKGNSLKSDIFRCPIIEKDYFRKSDLFRWSTFEKGNLLKSNIFDGRSSKSVTFKKVTFPQNDRNIIKKWFKFRPGDTKSRLWFQTSIWRLTGWVIPGGGPPPPTPRDGPAGTRTEPKMNTKSILKALNRASQPSPQFSKTCVFALWPQNLI